ncbi:hypothetical protein RHSIM_RhsimUnG0014400 [Rhododendron simsii]|uniref:Pentatricopeptide repeat-containing protein n=1 Tax=Rhododendron simsii TaxID=118357 RepID=A0A834G3L0_RHOSS|nr:hypothetical protein RHSIM_RhsimUnG0014400 [Rhododendron simsii]
MPTKNLVSWNAILGGYAMHGKAEEAIQIFHLLHRIGQKPDLVSFTGRAGKLEEAYSMIKKMPFEPDGCVWGALLSFCRVHNNMTLGEIAAKQLFKLEPTNPGNYILLSNIYASKGKWREVNGVREMMSKIVLRKDPVSDFPGQCVVSFGEATLQMITLSML